MQEAVFGQNNLHILHQTIIERNFFITNSRNTYRIALYKIEMLALRLLGCTAEVPVKSKTCFSGKIEILYLNPMTVVQKFRCLKCLP